MAALDRFHCTSYVCFIVVCVLTSTAKLETRT